MLEFEDHIPDIDEALIPIPAFGRAFLWDRWDHQIANTRVKLKWGPVRPSFKLAIFEPVVAKLIGARVT